MGFQGSRVRFMDHIGRIGVVGPFMALSAYVCMTPSGFHRGVVMVDAGYGFIPMALDAGDPCPDRMNILGLLRMTIPALLQFKDLDPIVGVGKECPPPPDRAGSRGQVDVPSAWQWPPHQRKVKARSDIALLKVSGAYLPLTIDAWANLFLCPHRARKRVNGKHKGESKQKFEPVIDKYSTRPYSMLFHSVLLSDLWCTIRISHTVFLSPFEKAEAILE